MPAHALPSLFGRNPAVLVVEDEFLIAMELEMILEQNGCRILGPAPTVKESLFILTAERPDLAVFDLNLRGEPATPVAAALRNNNIPFLISSAYAAADLDGSGILDGVENIGKPVKEDRLLAGLARLAYVE